MVSEQFVSNCIGYVRDKYPKVIRFVVDPYTEKQIGLYLSTHKYDMIMYMYGWAFLMALKKHFIEIEAYERCQKINDAINEHNKLCMNNTDLPYDYYEII